MSAAATERPGHILFSQHGWADTNRKMLSFGRAVADPNDVIRAPSLGYVRTWQRIDPLVDHVEDDAAAAFAEHPDLRARIVGHSMGGLIWIAVLDRHPEWRPRIDRLVLLGSPVGGTRLGTYLDPRGVTIGRDLSISRRKQAELVAAVVPTMSVAGDLLAGHDGTISVASTRLAHAHLVTFPWTSHARMLNSRMVRGLIRAYFRDDEHRVTDVRLLVERLESVPGIGPGDVRKCRWAQVKMLFRDGHTVRALLGPLGFEQAFVADNEGRCLYAGRVGWGQVTALDKALRSLKRELADALV